MLLGLFIMQVLWYSLYMAAPARRLRRTQKAAGGQEKGAKEETPGVSVILCARNEGYNLADYLPALLTQDYPTYEIIVVNDGSEDDTQDVIERYMTQDPRLHTTFVPKGARVGSTKKLALTLGAKAAQYDYLLLTDADCVPESDQWIREMVRGFSNVQGTKDVVLGYGAYFYEKGHVNRLMRYDTLFNGLHYLGAALWGHPYMGVGRNLAYRKALFFESGGFSHLMANRAGDDDLFVNHVATKRNTAVVLSPDSYTWSPTKRTFKEWWQQKRRHLSVSSAYRKATQWQLLFEPQTRGLFYATLLSLLIFRPSLTGIICAGGLFLLRWLLQTCIINVSAHRMKQHTFNPLTILWFDIVLPLVNLWMLVVPKRQNKW